MKTPHKHAELIIAWANGHSIEIAYPMQTGTIHWVSTTEPEWDTSTLYRIKPEPKQDLVKYTTAESGYSLLSLSRAHFDDDNLKLTFEGETGKLKSAEVIK